MSGYLAVSRRALGTTLSKTLTARPFSIAASRQASGETKGKNPDSTHTTRKDDRLDVQTDNSMKGREGKAQDVGGQATRERDEAGSKSKAKQEFPESPVQIGMEDERGGKGM